ncbi:MAG: hypothetical protein R3B89_17115 [Polyangiaceae bacterium]
MTETTSTTHTTEAPSSRNIPATRHAGMSEETREALARVLCLETRETRADILDGAIRNAASELGALTAGESYPEGLDLITIAEGIIARLMAACDLGEHVEAQAEAAKRAEVTE